MRLRLKQNQQRRPLGGHHFRANSRTFKEKDFESLVKSIRSFRVNNNIPVGDPEQEVLQYYLSNWPYMVEPDEESAEKADSEIFADWRSWIFGAWKRPISKFIPTKEAQRRWEVCEKCPLNRKFDWNESDESVRLTSQAFLIRRGVEVPTFLGFCSCHRADLSVFTLIESARDRSAKRDSAEQPPGCWVS